MKKLGLRKDTYGTEHLVRQNWRARPTSFPDLPEGHYVVCGFGMDIPGFEKLFVPDTLEDMQQLYDGFQNGGGLALNWYTGHEEIGIIGNESLLT